MIKLSLRRARSLVPLFTVLALAACSRKGSDPYAFTATTPDTHLGFAIAAGVHAVDCAQCHGTFPSFKQFDCLGCHTQTPTDAVHTTTNGYAYANPSCQSCHAPDPTLHPFDHKFSPSTPLCATCHAVGAAYAALPVAGFTHPAITQDCSQCHAAASWVNATAPAGVVADPLAAVTLNALIPRYSGTSIARVSTQSETLPMGMNHATNEVNMTGLACTTCHADANSVAYYPGRLHSSLANLAQPQPVACLDCHSGSVPTGFVGPTATSPARSPASGEMKHDAVLWSAGAPTATKVVTADCGTCHASPAASLQATWATSLAGTSPARYHAALTAASLPQPTSCLDCHANTRPVGTLTAPAAALPAGLAFDHAAAAGAMGDCPTCHTSTAAWSGGRFHRTGSSNPTSCLPCHAGERSTSTSAWASTSYTSSPFDYGTNTAGITHGDGQDCAVCHVGPGTGGAWGGTQSFVGGHFPHGAATVANNTCIACHMSQRPDLVLGSGPAATALGYDHTVGGTGDCIGCHQATVTAGTYVNYLPLPGGDWKGGAGYPGARLVSSPHNVTFTDLTLVRSGALVTGMTSIQDTIYNAMLHTSAQVPAAVSPGTSSTGDTTTCWHCHTNNGVGPTPTVTSFTNGLFHASLTNYTATAGGAVTPLPQPTLCLDCHTQMRPNGVVELGLTSTGSPSAAPQDVQPMDHNVSGVSGLDCSTCHKNPGVSWNDGKLHPNFTPATASCVPCHYPLMADGASANVSNSVLYAMSHASGQLTFQTCDTCHRSVSTGTVAATAWKTGAFHASVPSQPTACLDCHAVSEPTANSPTQSSWTYALAAGGTSSNAGQWMNHGAAPVAGADCVKCHAADAMTSGSAWSKADQFHAAISSPGTCQVCHGLTNGGGAVVGTNNNLPNGLTNSTTLTTASNDSTTGVPAGTYDQIIHTDVNVSGHDCAFCHTQVGRATPTTGTEWAQAKFHVSFPTSTPLVLNGTTGRCSNCHLNVKPGATFTGYDHSALTGASGSQDCSACHSWPGTGGTTAPNWLGAAGTPPYIAVGGFTIPAPPAATATTQAGITNLPHPIVAGGTSCATCHTGGVGGKNAIGYDHASALINAACNACHEAGSNLLGTPWNGATAQASGAGDTRPFTLTSIRATRGSSGGSCTITQPNHFYPIDCAQCHAVPAGTGAVTAGTAYTSAWTFPHTTSKMTNPSTCNMCHQGQGCGT